MNFEFDNSFSFSFGYIIFSEIKNSECNSQLTSIFNQALTSVNNRYSDSSKLSESEIFSSFHALFRSVGLDPIKNPPSSEALIRKIIINKKLRRINTAVDINKIISIETEFSCGIYDLEKISGDKITIFLGDRTTQFESLKGEQISVENFIMTKDDDSAFGSMICDSYRTAVTTDTQKALMLIYSPYNKSHLLKDTICKACNLMEKFCDAKVDDSGIMLYEKN